MTAARWIGAGIPLLLLTAAAALAAMLHAEQRQTRWRAARTAEQHARPPCSCPHRAALDELALHRAAVEHACCPGWWEPSHTYSHHPDCTKEPCHA
ncbi:hypothetical protein [Streptomyces sp. 35G-GA-8]|uniref:hypothetical protein n=1 Tax=Streptomyces sp. 35G-GA-8 TaxID=2939434 RepID=UPI00201EE28C|nr:hypothetical protein [Streptomyces sp. 35G-GA-8]MCL7377444.1 hypothetical protein [Streptomyces sp. 35G-GA-8]